MGTLHLIPSFLMAGLLDILQLRSFDHGSKAPRNPHKPQLFEVPNSSFPSFFFPKLLLFQTFSFPNFFFPKLPFRKPKPKPYPVEKRSHLAPSSTPKISGKASGATLREQATERRDEGPEAVGGRDSIFSKLARAPTNRAEHISIAEFLGFAFESLSGFMARDTIGNHRKSIE